MKIALTVKGVGLGAWLDDNYAHCGFVLLVDDENQFESWKNPATENKDQPPEELTSYIIGARPDVLVTGIISKMDKEFLTTQGIRVMDNCKGFVLELLELARG